VWKGQELEKIHRRSQQVRGCKGQEQEKIHTKIQISEGQ